ncbi:hypothetical protein, partial [Salmonella sp. s55962]|uniref:hypothetical protein n=1 Tax=Salmonella sp. s55962 TaxID=3159685 RepID=UPI003980EFC4
FSFSKPINRFIKMSHLVGQNAMYFNMASFLILDNQILQQVNTADVIPFLAHHNIIDATELSYIHDGATERIRRERLLQRLRMREKQGYQYLKLALSTHGNKYQTIISQIDKVLLPS